MTLVMCYLDDTYTRCDPILSSRLAYCYVITTDLVTYHDVGDACSQYGGLPMWFSEEAEITWLNTLLEAYSIDCIHLG